MEAELAALLQRYQTVRTHSLLLCESLEIDDLNLQAVPETSPLKWHLAHTSWFFETFLLKPFVPDYAPFDASFEYLFNSYYNAVGQQFPRAQRHLLSRPTAERVVCYRQAVDEAMQALLNSGAAKTEPDLMARVVLGLHHEQQHQELMLTDLKYNWSLNPLHPVYCAAPLPASEVAHHSAFVPVSGGLFTIGHQPDDATMTALSSFHFDNEGPAHQVWLDDFAVAQHLTTNAEYMEFIEDGGYRDPRWWTADGWACAQSEAWQAPLYWTREDRQPINTKADSEHYWHFTLHGHQPVDPHAPVCHVSLYEALAYANWAGKRLCRETEWEVLARNQAMSGHFQHPSCAHPYHTTTQGQPASDQSGLQHMFGNVWEWTQSAYSPYPGYQTDAGALGEYNGKFMMNQMVLRGGSIATPKDHIRASYRNFFYPKDRWQFSGIRLSSDR